jgi:glycosyltransferase involved in cell wall biosynthesis
VIGRLLANEGLLRRAERTLRDVAARLRPPRDEALLTIADAGYTLLTGRRAVSALSTHIEPPVNRLALRRAAAALEAGDLDTARERIDALFRAHPDSMRVLRLARDVQSRQGELAELATTLHRMHTLADDPDRMIAERMLLGRIVETDPRWLPRIAGPASPVEPTDDAVVLHLLKESVPYLTNGFTMRSRYNLLAQRGVGLDPVVVTNLGFPRLLGVEKVPPIETIDGIDHHRLDLGPEYPIERPFDRLLVDQAWLTARLAQRIRPGIIHVSSGHRGYETALVGLALREHVRRPVVYEVRSFFESTWSADGDWNERGEQYRRRFAAETRAIRAADHVITISEAMREDIVARGGDPDRVTVVPNGVDAAVFTPRPVDEGLRRRYGIGGRFTFGYVSNLDHPRENQELLVAATARLRARGRSVACLIVGDGKRRTEIEAEVRRAGVGDAVILTGRVPHDEVADHYALLDAFVVPRRDERAARAVTPLKPYEAMAMGRPLVVADLPALTEIAAPDERGLAFRTGDADALAAAIERLIDDPGLGRRIGEAGRAWVGTERSWAANGPRYREVYQRVLSSWAAGSRVDAA